MRFHELINEDAASTSSSNVALLAVPVGALGPGFDPNGDHGIYEKPKKKKVSKNVVLRR